MNWLTVSACDFQSICLESSWNEHQKARFFIYDHSNCKSQSRTFFMSSFYSHACSLMVRALLMVSRVLAICTQTHNNGHIAQLQTTHTLFYVSLAPLFTAFEFIHFRPTRLFTRHIHREVEKVVCKHMRVSCK